MTSDQVADSSSRSADEMSLSDNPNSISSVPISTLTFKYPRQEASRSDTGDYSDSSARLVNEDHVWDNLFGCLRTVKVSKELQCFSKLSKNSACVGHCNGFSATITCNRYQGNIESSEPESVVVNTRDLLYYPNTVLVIHPLLQFDLANQAGTSIRCYLPTKLAPVPQIYKVSRNLETPEQVDVVLERTPQQVLTATSLGQPTVVARSTGLLRSDIVFQGPDKSIKLIPVVQNPSVVLAPGQLQSPVVTFASSIPSSVETATQMMAMSATHIKSNQALHANRDSVVQMSPKNNHPTSKGGAEDRTHDGELCRPGYVIVCHNCGTESKNFKNCDSCKRVIPKDSRIHPDRYHQPSKSSQAQAVIDSALGNNRKANLSDYSIPKTTKRQAKKKPQEECIVLSSDEEEGHGAPEKRLKLDGEQGSNNNSVAGENPLCKSASAEDMSSYDSTDSNASGNRIDFHKELERDREIIEGLIKSNDSVTIMCRSFRVGSHKTVWKAQHTKAEFTVHICQHGVRFSMPHVKTPSKRVHVIIPKHATLAVTAHFDTRKLSYLIFAVGNKIARYIRESLGMTDDNKHIWFDPTKGAPCERNILFMIDEFGEGSTEFIKNVYKKDLAILDQLRANAVLVEISPPGSSVTKADETSQTPVGSNPEATSKDNLGKPELNSKEVCKSVGKGSSQENASSVKSSNNSNSKTETKKHVLRTQDKIVNGKLPAIKTKSDMDPILEVNKPILKWPKKQLGITLQQSDILTLRPEQFLNDQILDFWLLYVHNKMLSVVDRDRTFVFSTFFYNRLTTKPRLKSCPAWENDKSIPAAEKRHRRVKKWTKNVDIFSKDFIIVPINESCHWYVAVICFPGLDGPHWMNDNTPIEGWKNLVTTKLNRSQYVLPPGMQPRVDDKPRKKRRRVEEELPDLHDDLPAGVGVDNGISSKQDDDMQGNAPFPGVSTPEKLVPNNTSLPSTPTPKTVVAKTNEEPTPNKDASSKGVTVPPCHEFLNPDIDPFRDEAEDDPDEDNLFEEYYFTDSDDESSPESPKNETSEESPIESAVTQVKVEDGIKIEAEDVKPKVEELPPPADTRTDFRIKQPCILIFNSLPTFPRSRVMATLRDYLRLEYKERKGQDRPFTKFDMPGFEPNVPQQKNMCDCGIYVLQYVEQFFSDPFPSFLLALPSNLRKWFPQLKTKRKEIYDTIYELVKTENPENLHLMPKFEIPLPPPLLKPDKPENSASSEKAEKNGDNPASNGCKTDSASNNLTEGTEKILESSGKQILTKTAEPDENNKTEESPVKKMEKKSENVKILLKSDNLTSKDLLEKFNKQPLQESKSPAKFPRKSEIVSRNTSQQELVVATVITPAAAPKTNKPTENSESSKKILSNARPTILKNSKSMKVAVAQVESAPRQKITPVVPADEPMDIDL
ncbi:unnamed protein product [Allacma fusca]|uniref:Ubiquitin-like protease family profile domain-containing protein n=1 Tax=Allacma fusca TaxID=39272 RepID=A0A8J2PNX3_9HEXA|nr:unnamed protein product [Allacma fusca]CAG7838184.1 unnamed protein product [Allacma fusca]